MCGICGVYNFSPAQSRPADKGLVERMTGRIAHRGPDDSGVFVSGRVGIGNRRLSIIDLSKGHQPIYNEDGSMVIVYNGEVYNFAEVREDLINSGHVFTTGTDTETILHAYEQYGTECVHRFNGMFAFAIWDGKRGQLFLARDRLGVKPLFYAIHNGALIFGSEIKCILEYKELERRIDFQALDHYFSLGYIPAPHTIFDGIRKLLPGHLMVCDAKGVRISKYWDVRFEPRYGRGEDALCEEFISLLKKSVQRRLISDVPVGAFLSGGVDSSLIVALMSELSERPPLTFSIGFDDALYDESPYSELIARTFGTEHHNYVVKADAQHVLDEIVKAFDEPFANDGAIPCYHLCRETRDKVKVALSGLGGDELFGGYPRYAGFKLSMWLERFPLIKSRVFKKLVHAIPESKDGGYTVDRLKRFFEAFPLDAERRYMSYLYLLDTDQRMSLYNPDLRARIDFEKNFLDFAGYFRNDENDLPLNRVFYLDHHTYLPDDILALTDRMSMWHSLEVRVPFLDYTLVEFAATLPPETKIRKLAMKHLLKKAASGILPQEILKKRKHGFVGPLPLWLSRELKEYTLETLSKRNIERYGLFNYNAVSEILDQHFGRKRKYETIIWALLVFDKWHRMYMEK